VSDTPPPTLAEAEKGPAPSIIPLGGIGEIGMNMTVPEYGE